ncbi:ClpP/crotonase-like domain-containing protein [Pisolithus tinctorius]|nr:ClpP/crotonase-like domain-containing protein [Pisolithus tinctorius]
MLAIARMSNHRATTAITRTRAIVSHMSTSATSSLDQPVLFQSNGHTRTFVLNRAKKLNTLNTAMVDALRHQVDLWSKSDLCQIIIGTGSGRAFCAGGDVTSVLRDALDAGTRPKALGFFRKEFELVYILSQLSKPYVAVLDGITMGGGVGLSINAPFRVATEKTVFAMPETKIGFFPDVGASYFLPRLEGEVGTYLALTSETLVGREVFEHGLATHYITSRSVPSLLAHLAALENPSFSQINRTIEELHIERQPNEAHSKLTGNVREALDAAFCHDTVEEIIQSLEASTETPDTRVRLWAKQTLETLHMRSPTSLKVTLSAQRRGREMSLLEALQMEIGIAAAYCSDASQDFRTGITAALIDKIQGRPAWSPDNVSDVSSETVHRFFSEQSPYRSLAHKLSVDNLPGRNFDFMTYSLPSESELLDSIQPACKKGPVTIPDLLYSLDSICKRKFGIAEKILDIVHRKCHVTTSNGTATATWKGE